MRTFNIPLLLICTLLSSKQLYANKVNDAIIQKTLLWNKFNTEQNIPELEKLYTPTVIGYGVKSSCSRFMQAKIKFFKWAESFTQTIVSDFTIKKYVAGQIVCEFEKQTTYKGKTKNYPSYLVFEKQYGEYLIIEEGDAVTDANTGHRLVLGKLKSAETISLADLHTNNKLLPAIITVVFLILLVIMLLYFRFKRQKTTPLNHTPPPPTLPKEPLSETPSPLRQAPPKYQSPDDEQKEKGLEFERFIIRSFNQQYFEPIHWTSDKGVDGIYPKSNQNPDLLMQLNTYDGSTRFAVECKWRARIPGSNEVEICRSDQLDRYKSYGKKHRMEVFLALGIGGQPSYPNQLYIIPLRSVMHPVVKMYFLKQFEKQPGTAFYFNTNTLVLN